MSTTKDYIIVLLVVAVMLLSVALLYNDNRATSEKPFENNAKMTEAAFVEALSTLDRHSNASLSISSMLLNEAHKQENKGGPYSSIPMSQSIAAASYVPHGLVDGLKNGEKVQRIINSFPSSWKYPLLFSAIADEKYIYDAQMFVESLLHIGFSREDILLFCTNELCKKKLSESGINSDVVESSKHCEGSSNRVRCLISDGKASVILDILNRHYSVFFFDLDIFFKSPILQDLNVSDSIDLYVQDNNSYNGDSSLSIGGFDYLNYGQFLIRPSEANINFFKNLLDTYRKTKENDHRLFNRLVNSSQHSYAMLPQTEYYLHTSGKAKSNIRSAHMICIEGAQTKMFIGRELYGPFLTPSFYTDRKTVSGRFNPSMTKKDLVGLVSILLEVATLSHRSIRLIGEQDATGAPISITNYLQSSSIFDADKLFNEDNIQLVEQKYWEHVKQFNAHKNIVTDTVMISDLQAFSSLKTAKLLDSKADDLVLQIDQKSLPSFYNDKNQEYICKYYNEPKFQCLHACQGSTLLRKKRRSLR